MTDPSSPPTVIHWLAAPEGRKRMSCNDLHQVERPATPSRAGSAYPASYSSWRRTHNGSVAVSLRPWGVRSSSP